MLSAQWRPWVVAAALLLPGLVLFAGCVTRLQTPTAVASLPPGAVRHVVLFAFKPDTPETTQREVEASSAKLPSQIRQIAAYEWGTDLNQAARSEGLTHCIVFTFNNTADKDLYLNHPAHQAFKQLAMPHIARLLVLDYVPR
ncbi:MAG: Dabb family protein [Candidatus Hydrogenedentes bacterium]|nr:Dabb family protein [Candidatus Hydrogenedentota bacterium]